MSNASQGVPEGRWRATGRAALSGAKFGAVLAATLGFFCASVPVVVMMLWRQNLLWAVLAAFFGPPLLLGLIGATVAALLKAFAAALSDYRRVPDPGSILGSEPPVSKPLPRTDERRAELLNRLSDPFDRKSAG